MKDSNVRTRTAIEAMQGTLPQPHFNGEPVAIAVRPSDAIQLGIEDRVDGTQALTREDLQIPRLALVQAQSSDIPDYLKHLGEWHNNLTGEFAATIQAVPLSVIKGRTAFDRTFSRDSDPLCASDDALMPREEYVGKEITDTELDIVHTIDSQGCAQCPFSQFGSDGQPPICAKSYTHAMLDADTFVPFVVRFSRTGAGAGKQLNTIAKTIGRRKVVLLSAKQITSDQGNYFAPVVALGDLASQSAKDTALELSVSLGNFSKRSEPVVKVE